MLQFHSDCDSTNRAFSLAVAEVMGNVKPYHAGLLPGALPCLMAGRNYSTPWTRDTAINLSNGFVFLDRDVSRNTLLAVADYGPEGPVIGGQYWDKIIWLPGALHYLRATGDRSLLPTVLETGTNTLRQAEADEFDPSVGLFRGPAVYADGVAAYPDRYLSSNSSDIEPWALNPANAAEKAPRGNGLPMFALSTNCVYYLAYRALAELKTLSGQNAERETAKAEALKAAVNRHFWNEERGSYDYLAHECDYQEALGDAFALLSGIASPEQTASVLARHHSCPFGTPCLWPNFPRYEALGGYGRHAGTVWPFSAAYWGLAAGLNGDRAGFEKEFRVIEAQALREGQFYELYHPDTGEPIGGLQECGNSVMGKWKSCEHQSWSATAYLAMLLYGVLGMRLERDSVRFRPRLPEGMTEADFEQLSIRGKRFTLHLTKTENAAGFPREAEVSLTENASDTVELTLSAE